MLVRCDHVARVIERNESGQMVGATSRRGAVTEKRSALYRSSCEAIKPTPRELTIRGLIYAGAYAAWK